MPDESWLGMCTIPAHDDLAGDLQQLKTLIELNGFELLEGSFVRRDGTHSKFFLKPNNVDRLLARAQQARTYEHKPT